MLALPLFIMKLAPGGASLYQSGLQRTPGMRKQGGINKPAAQQQTIRVTWIAIALMLLFQVDFLLLPYANTCGLVALAAPQRQQLSRYYEALRDAAAKHDPKY